jgi:hypothetical protein
VQAAKYPKLYGSSAGLLMESYISERTQFVRSGGQKFSVGAVTCGVPQGSVVGPLLRVIRYYRFHIYADDLQSYHTCAVPDFQRCIDELNLDLQLVHEWTAAACEWS